jgi:hypothetical protein
MIKSKLAAITLVAAIGLAAGFASPASAAHYGPSYWAPGQTGGGSAGYNNNVANDYRLKHHAKSHAQSHSQ